MVTTPVPIRVVPAVDRAARLLDLLASEGRDWSLTEIASELASHKGTTRDILLTLQQHGLVSRDSHSGRYRLGLGAVRLARAALSHLDLRDAARPAMETLLAEGGETVLLGARDGEHVVIVDVATPSDGLHMSATVGQRLALCAGSFGKVFLAEPGAFEQYLESGGELRAFTERSQTDADAYAAELSVVRATGYALDDEEYLQGVRAASASIRGPVGSVVGALTVAGFTARLPLSRLEELGRLCRAAADAIAARWGGGASEPPHRPGGSHNGQV